MAEPTDGQSVRRDSRPHCEAKHCKALALGLLEVEGVRWLVCSHHARQHGVAKDEIAHLETMWERSEAATDCDQQHRTRGTSS